MFEIGQVLDDLVEYTPRQNICPTQRAPVVRATAEGTRTLAHLRWGLIPRWSKGPDTATVLRGGARLINARAETAPTLNSFRDAVRRRRCLVPATGFYEWRSEPGPGGKVVKQPFSITPAEGVFLAMGGLWERWQPPEGGPEVETFTILTCEANDDVRALHDRMPVVIPPEAWKVWLDPCVSDLDALAVHVQSPAPGALVVAPVDKAVFGGS